MNSSKRFIIFIGFGLSLCFLFFAFTGLLTKPNDSKEVLGAEDTAATLTVSPAAATPATEQMRFPAGANTAADTPTTAPTSEPATPTDIMLLTCTPTPSNTPKPTKTPGPSPTKKPTHTPTPTSRFSPTPTRKPTKGPSPTPTNTPTKKPTRTPTPTAPVCWCTLTPAARATLTAAAAHTPTTAPSTAPVTNAPQGITDTPAPSEVPSATPVPTETPSLTPTPVPSNTPTLTPSPTNTPTPVARIELQEGLGENLLEENGTTDIPVALRVINTGEVPLQNIHLMTDLKAIGSFGPNLLGISDHRLPFNGLIKTNPHFDAATDLEHFSPLPELAPGEQFLVIFTANVKTISGRFTLPSAVTANSSVGDVSSSDVQALDLVAPSPTPTSLPTETPSSTPTASPTDTARMSANLTSTPGVSPSPTPQSRQADITGNPSITPGSVLSTSDSVKQNNLVASASNTPTPPAPTSAPSASPVPTNMPTQAPVAALLVNTGIPIIGSVVVGSLLLLSVMAIKSVDAMKHNNFTPLPDYLQDELDEMEK